MFLLGCWRENRTAFSVPAVQQGLSAGYVMITSSNGAANTKGVLRLLQYSCKCGFSEVVGYERAGILQLAWS